MANTETPLREEREQLRLGKECSLCAYESALWGLRKESTAGLAGVEDSIVGFRKSQ
jgi:hypothetical protein